MITLVLLWLNERERRTVRESGSFFNVRSDFLFVFATFGFGEGSELAL